MDKKTLKEASHALTDKHVTIVVEIVPTTLKERILQKIGFIKKKRVFQVRPVTLGNLIRISELMLTIDEELIESLKKSYVSVAKHLPAVVNAVAIGLHNKKDPPPDSLIEFIKYNMTPSEMASVLTVILKQLNIHDFIVSIALVRGINVLDQTNQAASRIQQGS